MSEKVRCPTCGLVHLAEAGRQECLHLGRGKPTEMVPYDGPVKPGLIDWPKRRAYRTQQFLERQAFLQEIWPE
jgi:hypothetical protein